MELTDISLDIYLIRHSDPEVLPNHWSSSTTPLSQHGVIQAEKLAKQLKNHRFDALFTSPFNRAKETAEIIAKECVQVKIQELNWLAEINVGEWAGCHKNEINQQVTPSIKQFLESGYNKRGPLVGGLLAFDKNFSFSSGESLKDFWNRVSTGFHKTLYQFKGKSGKKICLIGHGGSFTVIILNLLNKSFSDREFPVFMFRKADLAIIRIREGQIFFLQMNPFLSPLNEFTLDSNKK
ncbi:MAG: histidine phosphatase family protein [Candidatus Hodarchaeales archaeon]|jgi:probable phosphoglycerate mutase